MFVFIHPVPASRSHFVIARRRKDLPEQIFPGRLGSSSNSQIRDDYMTAEHHKSEVLASLMLLDRAGRLSFTFLSRSVPSSLNMVIISISTAQAI